jgi:polar amino acid transport system permease protein
MCALLIKGAFLTLQISLAGVAIGLVLGTAIGIANCDRMRNLYLSPLAFIYVTLFRGTPVFVQLLFVYFALPEALGIDLAPIPAGIITLGLNSGAYLSETIRGGINWVPDGQWEAAQALGYTRRQSLQYIILPQALRNVTPAITNELATLIKDSSVLMIIGVPELIKVSRDIVARELNPMEVYAFAGLGYLIMTSALALFTKRIEKRLT